MDLLYNYAGIEAGAAALNKTVVHAQALLDTGRAQKSSLQASWQGTSGTSFQDSFHRFEMVNQNIIDVGTRACTSLTQASSGMQGVEMTNAGVFP